MRQEDPFSALGLPDEEVPEPAGGQIRMDLKREGTLVWLLQQMIDEMRGYKLNVLGADLRNPDQMLNVVDWQARKQVLEQLLERLITMIGEEDGN